jgi:alpha-ketoglutarate-dependent 2,4-dichlorophenoxyacetate dioxygenase
MLTTRQIGPCFAAEVEGLDLTRPLTPADAKDVHAAMDEYAVLVFHGRPITQEQQMAFTLSLGEIEHATGTGLRETYRLPTTFADVSNIDAPLRPGQSPLALRQLVQGGAREVLDPPLP